MAKIKFSHNYPKLWNQEYAELIDVRHIKIDKTIHPDLLEYDTKTSEGEYFPLKTGNYVQLTFMGNKRIPFCTIRSAYPESKVKYYNEMVGEVFNIELTPPAEDK